MKRLLKIAIRFLIGAGEGALSATVNPIILPIKKGVESVKNAKADEATGKGKIDLAHSIGFFGVIIAAIVLIVLFVDVEKLQIILDFFKDVKAK